MQVKLQASEPKEIEFTMSITMTLRDWMRLNDQLGHDYPSWHLSAYINKLIEQAKRVYLPDDQETDQCHPLS